METFEIREIETKEGYNLWSESFDHIHSSLLTLEEEGLKKMLGPVKGLKILDVGCGTGRNALKLNGWGAEVEGLDFSEKMLEKARKNSLGTSIRYTQHDLHQPLPYEDQTFDALISSLVVEHIKDLAPVFREMGRVCKKQGHLYISDIHPTLKLKNLRARFLNHTTKVLTYVKGFPHDMSEYILGIRDSGLILEDMKEFFGSEELGPPWESFEDYVGFPLLVTFKLRPA